MYAQDDMTTAEALWSSIRLSDVVSEESLAIADDAENIFDHPEKLLEFITRYAQKKGMDVTPLMGYPQKDYSRGRHPSQRRQARSGHDQISVAGDD